MSKNDKFITQFFAKMNVKHPCADREIRLKMVKEMSPSLKALMTLKNEETRNRLLLEAEKTYVECINILMRSSKTQEYLNNLAQMFHKLAESSGQLKTNLEKLTETLKTAEKNRKQTEKIKQMLHEFDTEKILVS